MLRRDRRGMMNFHKYLIFNLFRMKKVTIHTDGACKGNPGRGACAAVLVCGGHRKEVAAAYRLTTNNRMEILAAVVALELLKESCEVEIHSDSQYLINAVTRRWIDGWKRSGWVKTDRKPVKNKDLWQRLDAAMGPHRVHWHWVKGHAGHRENERCDELANLAVAGAKLSEDAGFVPNGKD